MKTGRTIVAIACLLCTIGAVSLTSNASTTLAGAIVGIDQAKGEITYQTQDGRIWTLPVADSTILKQEQVAKGDRVNIDVELNELDFSKKITKITKIRDNQPIQQPNPSMK